MQMVSFCIFSQFLPPDLSENKWTKLTGGIGAGKTPASQAEMKFA
jgi:hypothetical protein